MPLCKRCDNRIETKDSAAPYLFILISPFHTNIKNGELCHKCANEVTHFIEDRADNKSVPLDTWRK